MVDSLQTPAQNLRRGRTHVEETSAVTPLDISRRKEGVPDTYPFGF